MRKAISWVLGLSNQLKRHPAAIFFGILITITSCETSCYVFMSLFSQLLFMSTNIGGSIIMSANTSDNHPNSDSAGFQNPFNNMAQQTALPPSYDDAPQLAASTSLGYTPSGKPRLHQCLVCLRSFARLEHLKRHERSHTKEKPFNCGVCSRKFSRRDLLLRHAEKLHGGCAEAVQRLRRRRRSAVKKDEDGAGSGSTTVAVSSQVTVPDTIPDLNVSINDNNERAKPRKLSSIADFGNRGPVASNGPPLSTFVTDYGRRNSSNADQDVEMMSRPHALKVRVNSLFNNFISRNSTRSNSIVNEENPPNLKRVRRASFSASSGENYAMPKYLPSNMAIDQLHINNYVNQNPSNHFYADSVEFSTPQFLPNEEELKDGTNPMIPKLHNIPEISLNSDNSYDVNTHNSNFNFNIPNFEKPQEQELRKIGQNVDNLHLSQQKNKLDNTKMDVDEKDSSLYGDYNIYGIESPDAEDWVNKVLGSSQIEFLTNIKNSNFETNNNKPTITEEKQKTNNVYDDFSKRINDFQNQLNKFSSDESSSYSTNVKNSPNNNTETKDNQNGDGPENEFGLLYGYSFYSDDFYGLSEPKLSKQMNEHLKNSFGIYGNPKNAIKKDNSSTDNDRKLKSEEISQEYDLISELNNLQNFQFYLNNSSKEGLSQMKKSALANNMNRNDSGKSTNSTQTMVSSNSSNQEQLLNNLIQSNGATSTDSKNAMPHSNNNGNLYFQHFNNISNGYSYYGVNVNNSMATPSDLSSSNINSPIRNVSPKMLESNNSSNIFLNRNYSQQLNSLTTSNPRPIRMPLASKTNGHPETKQSPKTKLLFSKYSRSKIFKTLLKYPFIGIPSPTIVDNQRLNEFVGVFCDKFINHMPFIHEFFLTEANMDKLTSCYWESSSLSNAKDQNPKEGSEDSVSDEKDAAAVCLPLLVATLGAIVSNNKREASNLYEASRRCIHVYLDSRKKNNLTPNNSSPLWLIQSLTLSVIYGLFAEFDSSSEIILKQVNALIALIRSSNLNKLKFDQLAYNKEPQKRNKEVLLLIYESKIRTVYTIFNISNLLNYFYGLKIEKIFNINEMYLKLPNFELNFHSTLGENSTSCVHIDINTPDFQTVLHKLVNKEVLDEKVSAYGLVSLQFGLHQYLALRDSNVNQDEDLLERWDLNFMSQIPRYMNKNHELFYNDSCNLLRLDARVLGNYLVFKHFSKNYINLNKIRYSSVWSKSWKKIAKTLVEANEKTTDNLALRSELQSVKFGIKILIDLFFVEDAVLMNSGLPTSNGLDNDENDLFAIGIIDNMVSKKSFTKILSLNLQILFDIFLVLCKFSFNFEKYCNGIDGVVINSIKQGPTTSNNQHGSSLGLLFEDDHGNRHIGNDSILGLLNNQSFMKKLKYYKLILGIFSKLEEFSVLHYGLESHSSMSQTNNLDNLAVMEEKNLRYKTSLKILRVGEFLFDKIFDEELGFNIFQNLGEGLLQLRKYLVWEIEKTNV